MNEALLGPKVEALAEREVEELLNLRRLGKTSVNVHLEVITLTGRIDAHSNGIAPEATMKHSFGEVDQREPAEEVRPRQAMKLRGGFGRERFVVEPLIVIERCGSVAIEPCVHQFRTCQ